MKIDSSLSGAARAELDRWLVDCAARPGRLPAACEPVQTRLIRAVGRGELPGIGPVFVKVMGFPRPRDVLRYTFRALPAAHEGELLRALALRDPRQRCPEVLAIVTARRFGLPALSVLVTKALPVVDRLPSFERRCAVAARLADCGLFHPDLNPGNFLQLDDGEVAIIDLQSAHLRGGPLGGTERLAMAGKMASEIEPGDELRVLAETGLIAVDQLDAVRAAASAEQREALRRRIGRCEVESTEFTRRRRWNGVEFGRRAGLASPGVWVARPDARQLWRGDRVCELLGGEEPLLLGMFRRAWWAPGSDSVRLRVGDEGRLVECAAGLLEAERAFSREPQG